MLLLCGCSWIHWRENPSGESMIDAGPEKSCSLELAQDRKSLPRRVLALGTPTLLVIRVGTQSEPDRLVRNGQAIYFAAGKLNVEASDFSHAQRTWKIEALDSAGRRLADSVPRGGLSSVRGRRTATIRRRKALHRRFLRRQDWPHAVSAGTVRVTVPA
jgi:hypothetical protein